MSKHGYFKYTNGVVLRKRNLRMMVVKESDSVIEYSCTRIIVDPKEICEKFVESGSQFTIKRLHTVLVTKIKFSSENFPCFIILTEMFLRDQA
jgi:hypothetical protein